MTKKSNNFFKPLKENKQSLIKSKHKNQNLIKKTNSKNKKSKNLPIKIKT